MAATMNTRMYGVYRLPATWVRDVRVRAIPEASYIERVTAQSFK
jgi:hypothetical protein